MLRFECNPHLDGLRCFFVQAMIQMNTFLYWTAGISQVKDPTLHTEAFSSEESVLCVELRAAHT